MSLLLDLRIFFLTIFKVFTNADNENIGATVVTEPETVKVSEEAAEQSANI